MAQPVIGNKDDINLEMYSSRYAHNCVEYVITETCDVHHLLSTDPQYLKQYLDIHIKSLEISNVSVPTDATNNAEPIEGFSWTAQTTKLLLSLYKERKKAFRDPKIKKKKLWADICEKFVEKGYKNISEDCLDRKIRNMKKTYRTIKDNNKKSASGRGRISWEYFDMFEDIFQDDCTINIGSTLSSLNDLQENKRQKECQENITENVNSVSCNSELQQFFSYIPYSIHSRSPSPLSVSSTSSIIQSHVFPTLTLDDSASSVLQEESLNEPSSSEQDTSRTSKYENRSFKHKGLYMLRKEQLQLEEKRVKVLQELVESINTANSIQENRNELLRTLLIQRNEKSQPNN